MRENYYCLFKLTDYAAREAGFEQTTPEEVRTCQLKTPVTLRSEYVCNASAIKGRVGVCHATEYRPS